MGVAIVAAAVGVLVGLSLGAGGDDHPSQTDIPASDVGGSPATASPSEHGAVAAFASAIEQYSLDVLVDRDAAKRTFSAIGTPAFVRSELIKWDRAADTAGGRVLAEAAATGHAFAQTVPLRFELEDYDGERAVVRLWEMTVLAGRRLTPSAQFSTDRATLVWDSTSWRVESTTQLREGPTPGALRSELTRSSRSFSAALAGLKVFGNAD